MLVLIIFRSFIFKYDGKHQHIRGGAINAASTYRLATSQSFHSTIVDVNNSLLRNCLDCCSFILIPKKGSTNFKRLWVAQFMHSFLTYRRFGISHWSKILLQWANKKTIGLMYTIGWYRSHSDSVYGSGFQIDIHPFSPFAGLLRQFKRCKSSLLKWQADYFSKTLLK